MCTPSVLCEYMISKSGLSLFRKTLCVIDSIIEIVLNIDYSRDKYTIIYLIPTKTACLSTVPLFQIYSLCSPPVHFRISSRSLTSQSRTWSATSVKLFKEYILSHFSHWINFQWHWFISALGLLSPLLRHSAHTTYKIWVPVAVPRIVRSVIEP